MRAPRMPHKPRSPAGQGSSTAETAVSEFTRWASRGAEEAEVPEMTVRRLIDEALAKGRGRLVRYGRSRSMEAIRLYWGLDAPPMTWRQVGARMGLSLERARQLGHRGERLLAHYARKP